MGAYPDDGTDLEAVLDLGTDTGDCSDDLVSTDLGRVVLDGTPFAGQGRSVRSTDTTVQDFDCRDEEQSLEVSHVRCVWKDDETRLAIDVVLVPFLGLKLLKVEVALARVIVESGPTFEFVV